MVDEYELYDPNKTYEIGDKYLKKGGCDRCGSDLEVVNGVAIMCINWQHPNIPEAYNRKGNRTCNFALMAG